MLGTLPSGGTGSPLNLQKRIGLIEGHLGSLLGLRVLDVGCGPGDYVRAMCARGADAWGVDLGAPPGERVIRCDAQALGFSSKSFDAVLLNEVLEHLDDQVAALDEARRVLRPGGVLLVFSPNRCYPFETHATRWRGRRVPYLLPGLPYVPRLLFDFQARNYWPWELRRVVRRAGFAILRTGYVWQTFEGLSRRALWIPRPRRLFAALERVPVIRALGVSQFIAAQRQGLA